MYNNIILDYELEIYIDFVKVKLCPYMTIFLPENYNLQINTIYKDDSKIIMTVTNLMNGIVRQITPTQLEFHIANYLMSHPGYAFTQ